MSVKLTKAIVSAVSHTVNEMRLVSKCDWGGPEEEDRQSSSLQPSQQEPSSCFSSTSVLA